MPTRQSRAGGHCAHAHWYEAIKLKFALEPMLWPVLADNAEVENAILNLCLNAEEHRC
jgi:hypothetical protein